MKNRRIGSSRMYWVKVTRPTSNRIKAVAKLAADTDSVISHTVKYESGTRSEPSAVQHCRKFGNFDIVKKDAVDHTSFYDIYT